MSSKSLLLQTTAEVRTIILTLFIFFCLRLIMEFEYSIILYFLVAGYTENIYDAPFDHVKQRLKIFDVHCPLDMLQIIMDISRNEALSTISVN